MPKMISGRGKKGRAKMVWVGFLFWKLRGLWILKTDKMISSSGQVCRQCTSVNSKLTTGAGKGNYNFQYVDRHSSKEPCFTHQFVPRHVDGMLVTFHLTFCYFFIRYRNISWVLYPPFHFLSCYCKTWILGFMREIGRGRRENTIQVSNRGGNILLYVKSERKTSFNTWKNLGYINR